MTSSEIREFSGKLQIILEADLRVLAGELHRSVCGDSRTLVGVRMW